MSSRVVLTAEKTVKNRFSNFYNQIFICNNFLLFVQYLRPMGHLNTITPQLLLNDKGDNVQQYNNTSTQQRINASNCVILYMEENTCDCLVYAWFV